MPQIKFEAESIVAGIFLIAVGLVYIGVPVSIIYYLVTH